MFHARAAINTNLPPFLQRLLNILHTARDEDLPLISSTSTPTATMIHIVPTQFYNDVSRTSIQPPHRLRSKIFINPIRILEQPCEIRVSIPCRLRQAFVHCRICYHCWTHLLYWAYCSPPILQRDALGTKGYSPTLLSFPLLHQT